MGEERLQHEHLDRTESFGDRCFHVAESLQRDGRFARIVDQLAASGSPIGASIAEAGEAMSIKDFRNCIAIAVKEAAETLSRLRLSIRRDWLPAARLNPLLVVLGEIKLILGSILTRTSRISV